MNKINHRCKQKGFTIVEVLVTLAVIAVGVAGVTKLVGGVTQSGGETKAKSQAVYLAQSTLENIRGQDYADIASGDGRSVSGGNAQYTISQSVVENQGLGYKNVQVAVTWENANGKSEIVNLNAVISKADELNTGKMLASASTDCVVSSRRSGEHDGESDHEDDTEHGDSDHSSDHDNDSEHASNDHSDDHEDDTEHGDNDHSGNHDSDSDHASNHHSDDHDDDTEHGDNDRSDGHESESDDYELVATCDADVRTERDDEHHGDDDHHSDDDHHGEDYLGSDDHHENDDHDSHHS